MNKILTALWLWSGVCSAQEAPDLVGRWRSVETSKGGIGAMYDFFNDGTARFSPGAIVPMQYRLDGDRLTTYPVDGPAFTVSFSDDDHLRMSVQGGIEDYVRLGTAAGTGRRLVGEWSGKRNMDGNIVAVHWIFNVDSSAILMIRFLTLQGRYEFRDGRLIATFGNRPLSGPATLANGILSVQHDGKTTRLQRY